MNARFAQVKLTNGKKVLLRDYVSNSSYLVGIEVNNEGDEIVPKGKATQRQHVIVVDAIKSIIPLRINLTYGELEPIPQIEGEKNTLSKRVNISDNRDSSGRFI